MLLLTSTLTVLTLCVLHAHAAFNYTFASPSRSPHDAAYTVIEVPVATHVTAPRHNVRQFGFFHRNPTPSATVTPTPLMPTPVVISPYTTAPTITPTPLVSAPAVTSSYTTAPTITPTPLVSASAVTSSYTTAPTSTPTPQPLNHHVTTRTDASALSSSNTSARPTPEAPSVLVVPAPLTKRIIAIPLRVPRRGSPPHIMPSPTNPSPSAFAYQFEPMPYDTQRELFVPQRQPPVRNTPSPTVSAHKFEQPHYHIQHDVLMPDSQTPLAPEHPLPSPLVSFVPASPTPTGASAPPTMDCVDRAYGTGTTIPPHADVVAALSPLPTATVKIIPMEIRLQKRIHASPLAMPSASPNPSPQLVGANGDAVHMVGSSAVLTKTFENNFTSTPEPASSQTSASPTVTPAVSYTHLYTITPSVVPSAGSTNGVRMARRHRIPSVRTKTGRAPTVPSPTSTPSTTPSKPMVQEVKVLNRHRIPIRRLSGKRLPSFNVRNEAATDTIPSPSSTPSSTPSKSVMQEVKLLNRRRVPVKSAFGRRLPSLRIRKGAAPNTIPSPSSTPSATPLKPVMQDVKMLNRRRIPIRKLHRYRLSPLIVRKEGGSGTITSDYAPEDSNGYRGTITPTPEPPRAPVVYGARMARRHRIPSVKAKKQAAPQLERTQVTTYGNTGNSSSSSVYNSTIGPTPSASMNVYTVYSTPVVIRSSVPPSPSSAPDMHEDSSRLFMDLENSAYVPDIISPSVEAEDYCESVKQCMCAVIDHSLLSSELLSYCDHLNLLNYSFCEQSKEAHIFLQFWTNTQGAKVEEGMALLNECNLDDIKALLHEV